MLKQYDKSLLNSNQGPTQDQQFLDLFGTQNRGKVESDLNQFVAKGMKLLHSPETADTVIAALKNSPDPINGVSDTVNMIIGRVDGAARDAGEEVHDAIKLKGAIEIFNDVVKLGEVSKAIPKMSEEEKTTALAVSIEKYISGEIKAGRIDGNKLKDEVVNGFSKLDPKSQQSVNDATLMINDTAMSYSGGEGNATV